MTKDHFVPRFIIRNFRNSSGGICIYNKDRNKIIENGNHYNQMQQEDFHSKKSLSELKQIFKHIEINPIFSNPGDALEGALNLCLEGPMGKIVKNIVKKFEERGSIVLTSEEENFIKEYASIQHLRTLKFRTLSKEFNRKVRIPSDFGDQVIEAVSKRKPDIKAIIKKNDPSLNRNERRVLELKWRKKLKKNPLLIEEMRDKIFEESLDQRVKEAEQNIKDILTHLDAHSADIINVKYRNSFFKRCELEDRDVVIVINLTEMPFVLGDTGIVLMADNPEGKKNLSVFLPIHPQLLIGLSNELPRNAVIDEKFVDQFNRISGDESYKNVYSDSKDALKYLVV